jgi:hypothetical protein
MIKDQKNVRLEICLDVITIPIKCGFTIDEYTHGSREIENLDARINYIVISLTFVGSERQQ